jgi:hypothetical protein
MSELCGIYLNPMKPVTLIFPDTTSLAEFILRLRISNSESNSANKSLTAKLSDHLINVACKEYGARLMNKTKSQGK